MRNTYKLIASPLLAFWVLVASYSYAKPVLLIDFPELLVELENQLPFTRWLNTTTDASAELKPLNNQQLAQLPAYRAIINSITADLELSQEKDPGLSVTMAKSHRLFNKKWLSSPKASYDLVGVVNRLDRQPFSVQSCGEIRLIYRLAYQTQKAGRVIRSRLPFTVNVVFQAADDKAQCRQAAKAWQLTQPLTVAVLLAETGPLNDEQLSLTQLKSIEVNMQAIRWPSTVRPNMGGYAEYFLRVFQYHSDSHNLELAPLENTPSIDYLNQYPEQKRALLKWLKRPENIQRLDQGILIIPEQFLAKKINSYALHGLARESNRPFDQLFKLEDFADVDFKNTDTFKTSYALLRRLNDLTCSGCHQARTIAGFHFLGKDNDQTSPVNSIYVSQSPHLINDGPRRLAYTNALLEGLTPNPARPFSERATAQAVSDQPANISEGGIGAHCSRGIDPSFRGWQCAEELYCGKADEPLGSPIGRCMAHKPSAGEACKIGTVTQHPNPLKDRISNAKTLSCGSSAHCEQTRVGFPSGMCSRGCSQLQPGETCGSIAVLYGFNQCLAANKPFDQCLAQNVRPAALMQCDEQTACRDDYICTKTTSGKGACIPPYFLFQLRVDGHPKP